ncbi:hypothetical protein PPYR_00465 [Photinus pyralis]|uniref:Ubiquitin-like domain-containing protein n=1 Tax=Photinus pyralis TaxID=7054 RepID=A0A1Y1MVE5_PHOPY|nr:homocysteine-responsive endoplasmic reticulum-resident ubiquitin-like domain member 2 protein [Photinus pyralis]KAB0803495.1 hypothetical protein PPYR_00465 [Photinus pyralis]
MEALPVTLIVKAPNQQIEDQTIKCELSWTINKLKQHLSEVYPSKPPKHEQKLIYSGQLLPDAVVLGDVLRQYEGQETHTVHLVCTTRQNSPLHNKPSTSQSMPDASTSAEIPPTNNENQQQHVPNFQWNTTPIDVNQYAMQMAWMQHAYMQYMTQYMNSSPSVQLNRNTDAQEAVRGDAPEAQDPQQAPAQPPRDQENGDRDWLDLFYVLTRAIILISIVYYYSTLLRFVFVLSLGVGIYLYQIGFFRNLNNNNNNHNNNNNVNAGEEIEDVPQFSVLTTVWTFFTAFFTSLIPEVPQAV